MKDVMEKTAEALEALDQRTMEVKNNQTKLLEDVSRLDGVTKQALADLGKMQTTAQDFAAQLKRVQVLLQREARANFGDPIQRVCADEANRHWLIGCARRAAGLELTPEQRTAITGVDSGVGQAVSPQETAAAIYDVLLQYGQWATLGVMPVGGRTQIIPLITGRPTAYWVASGAQITEGAVTGSSVTLTIKEAAAWIPVALGVLDDAELDLSAWILEQLGQAVAYRLDWACFAADGTNDTTDGAYTGIAVGGTAATAGTGNTTVATLELEDFLRCLTTVDAGVLSRPAKWWIHPQILAKIAGIKDSNGRPLFQNALEAPAPGAIGSILGYPVVVTGAMPSTDAANKVVAVFGDPQGCAVGIRKQFDFARSTDFQFDYHREAFKVVVRAGTVIKTATAFAMLKTAAT
jgi:HK97 family phage major capsid protein